MPIAFRLIMAYHIFYFKGGSIAVGFKLPTHQYKSEELSFLETSQERRKLQTVFLGPYNHTGVKSLEGKMQ